MNCCISHMNRPKETNQTKTKGETKSRNNERQNFNFYITVVLIMLVAFCFGQAAYIHTKAIFSQVLLAHAWQRAQASGIAHKPWPWADVKPIAILKVPALGVQQIVLDSHAGEALAFGPGMITHDNALATVEVLAGHRDTHFKFLKNLEPGMAVTLTRLDGSVRHFEVRTQEILNSQTNELPLDAMEPTLFLVTCYPFNAMNHHGPLRYVLTAHAKVTENTSKNHSIK